MVLMAATVAFGAGGTASATGEDPTIADFGLPELVAAIGAADAAAGVEIAQPCLRCHTTSSGGGVLIGPSLFEIVGRPLAATEGFAYSLAMRTLAADGAEWSLQRLDAFLEAPAIAIPGTRMGFGGIAEAEDRHDLLAYLVTLSDDPIDLGAGVVETGFRPLTFTADQAALGASLYQSERCEACHGALLRGVVDEREEGEGGDGPPISGPRFAAAWFDGNVWELFAATRESMPPRAPGSLSDDDYAALLAYILQVNGFAPADEPLPTEIDALSEMVFQQ